VSGYNKRRLLFLALALLALSLCYWAGLAQ